MKVGFVASQVRDIGSFYQSQGNNKFYSFYKAANNMLSELGSNTEVREDFEWELIPGVGPGIASRIKMIVQGKQPPELTGNYNTIMDKIDAKTKQVLFKNGIHNDAELKEAIRTDKANIIPDFVFQHFGRIRWTTADRFVKLIMAEALRLKLMITPVGSYRRKLGSVHDLDFILSTDDVDLFNEMIFNLRNCMTVTQHNNGSVMRKYILSLDGTSIQCDFKFVPSKSIPNAILHFTGPAGLNIMTRSKLKSIGYQLNEYSLSSLADSRQYYFDSESDLVEALNKLGANISSDPKDRN